MEHRTVPQTLFLEYSEDPIAAWVQSLWAAAWAHAGYTVVILAEPAGPARVGRPLRPRIEQPDGLDGEIRGAWLPPLWPQLVSRTGRVFHAVALREWVGTDQGTIHHPWAILAELWTMSSGPRGVVVPDMHREVVAALVGESVCRTWEDPALWADLPALEVPGLGGAGGLPSIILTDPGATGVDWGWVAAHVPTHRFWGYPVPNHGPANFRPLQREIVHEALETADAVVGPPPHGGTLVPVTTYLAHYCARQGIPWIGLEAGGWPARTAREYQRALVARLLDAAHKEVATT